MPKKDYMCKRFIRGCACKGYWGENKGRRGETSDLVQIRHLWKEGERPRMVREPQTFSVIPRKFPPGW